MFALTLVRSNLDNSSSVWSPGRPTVSDVKVIESIQRAATRYTSNFSEIDYAKKVHHTLLTLFTSFVCQELIIQ